MIADMIDRIVSYIYTRRMYGRRCMDTNPECPCCRAWEFHDDIFNAK